MEADAKINSEVLGRASKVQGVKSKRGKRYYISKNVKIMMYPTDTGDPR